MTPRKTLHSTLISLLCACAWPAMGGEFQPSAPTAFSDAGTALGDASLAALRGGFDAGGVSISFGIERAVYVNGALVATTSMQVSNLERIASGATTVSLNTGALSGSNLGTVVQNALDGQKIQSMTVVNASVSGMGALRSLNLQSSLRGAVIDSLRR